MREKDLEKLKEKRRQKIEDIKQRSFTEINKIKEKNMKKFKPDKMDFKEKRANHQKNEGRVL
ncbi:hypothetical protein QJ527_05440 [Enterococcus mundtii]|uniref:hypothetical protein n=1 Tax=Enterococcus TaxID=1350 RepID=UPI00044843AD|nr:MULTISPECIES: hypothetical protein [Enterococcus]AZP91886.1 hypothetical protein CYK55_01525 [Enterococcus mundtii]EYT95520.1 hypothetical protein AK89_08015 [Enterococcus mundtii CRL35]MDA9427861.1 hypothetical protein [Enterococcus mundtii 1A]MDK4210987.1 hypothetical protein [Enterococcus mundtii]MDO7879413.1 hypothetical protein [Enterococcus mundtii]